MAAPEPVHLPEPAHRQVLTGAAATLPPDVVLAVRLEPGGSGLVLADDAAADRSPGCVVSPRVLRQDGKQVWRVESREEELFR
ncbi:MAG: hypothetical protein R2853_16665 [Thermomicrobiales bacterium]